MVTSLRELDAVRDILEKAAAGVDAPTPELGVMIEVPSAALIADRLTADSDFLAIGTNDLTEGVLGVKRHDASSRPAGLTDDRLLVVGGESGSFETGHLVFDHRGVVGAIGITGPVERLIDNGPNPSTTVIVRDTARGLTRDLGGARLAFREAGA